MLQTLNFKLTKPQRSFLKLSFVALVVLLSIINISIYRSGSQVLGVSTSKKVNQGSETEFWDKFLLEHPSYIPGYLETNQIEKAMEIDPNYVIP